MEVVDEICKNAIYLFSLPTYTCSSILLISYWKFMRWTKRMSCFGMEVVDEICKNAITEDDDGNVAYENQPVIEKITEYKIGTSK